MSTRATSPTSFYNVLFVRQGTEEQPVFAGDVTPDPGFAICVLGRGQLGQFLAVGDGDAETAVFDSHIETVSPEANIAASSGRAHQVVRVVLLENAFQRKFPQGASVVGVGGANSVHSLVKQTSVGVERRGPSTMSLGNFEVGVAVPENSQTPFDQLIV